MSTYRHPATPHRGTGTTDWLRPFPRLIAAIWAGFWILFVWASLLYGGISVPRALAGVLLTAAFAGSAASIWLNERIGGILLTIEGLILILAYPQTVGDLPASTVDAVIIALALPPLVAGALCLACRRR
jgi:hypothetical protein